MYRFDNLDHRAQLVSRIIRATKSNEENVRFERRGMKEAEKEIRSFGSDKNNTLAWGDNIIITLLKAFGGAFRGWAITFDRTPRFSIE